jgi:hypothetical protein
MTLQVPHTRRQRNFPAPASRETLQELPNRRPPAPPSEASALQWERVSPDRYEIRLGTRTLGFIDVVGAVFVVLAGATYSRAIECAQTLVFEDALDALTTGAAPDRGRRATSRPGDVPAGGVGAI